MRLDPRFVGLLSLVVVTMLASPRDVAAQRTFSFGYDQPRSTAYGIAADLFDAKLKDLKVRVQATKTEDTHFPAYGAQTVHMPFGEVYTSLQTGVVNAAENGVNVYLANKHYEVAPVLSMTQHEANNNAVWVSEKTWNSLGDQEKKWVQAADEEVGRVEPGKALALEAESAVKLKKVGVQVVEGVDTAGFVNAARPVQDQLAA